MKTNNIHSILFLTLGLALAGCRQELVNPDEAGSFVVPEGEMAFCVGAHDLDGGPLTRGMVPGEEYTSVESLQLVCFDESGYYLGLRTAYPAPDAGSQPTTGTYTGYVPESTARIHFVANVDLDLSAFSVGTAEKVIMLSGALSTGYTDIDMSDPDVPKVCFWGYHKENTASAMKDWLQASNPNTVYLLRDRARIKLTFDPALINGSVWRDGSAGSGKKITSIKWGVHNGRTRGYLAPYASGTDPWDGYASVVSMHEYEDCDRYVLTETALDTFDPAADNYQYVFDDSNVKTSSRNDRICIVLEVNYEDNGGGNDGTKYLLAQLRQGEDGDEGEMVQIVRNNTYMVNVNNLAHDGYGTFAQAIDPDADDFTNAPDDVDITVPYITDGMHVLNLLSPKPVVVARQANQVFTVEFEYRKAAGEAAPGPEDFKIFWEENVNSGWTSASGNAVGSDLSIAPTSDPNTFKGTFTVKIGTIGTSYAFSDYLIIRHKKSGLYRGIHFYAVEKFLYRLNPVLEQVMVTTDPAVPYMGPSGDDTARPVFRLRFKLSQSLQEDLFPITVRLTSSTLEPFGDKSTSHTARLSGGFAVLNGSTATASDGSALVSSNNQNDWNYKSDTWGYWYGYTLNEYPKTGDERDGEVIIYLKDIRDAYAQASNQGVGLYLDVENFEPKPLSIGADAINYPAYPYNEGGVAGEYRVGSMANKYRAIVTGVPAGTYTLSKEYASNWLTVNPASVVVDPSGKLDFKFTVAANTQGERYEFVVFTNSSNPGVQTKVKVTQDAGGDALFRLKAASTSLLGNTEEVTVTVYSDVPWTLSLSSDGGTGTLSHTSGTSTGNGGFPVKLTMPVNYSTTDKTYTVTLHDQGNPDRTTSVVITQRKATEVEASGTFTAGNEFSSSFSHTLSNSSAVPPRITGTFKPVSGRSAPYVAGGLFLDRTERWDFDADTWLELRTNEVVKGITKVEFNFFQSGATIYLPASFAVSTLEGEPIPTGSYSYSTDGALFTWTPDPTVTGVHLDFYKGDHTYSIALVSFTVSIVYYSWE